MTETAFQLARVILILGLIIAAAALSTPRGRLPLALRGILRILHRDQEGSSSGGREPVIAPVPVGKKILAFLFVILAAILAGL